MLNISKYQVNDVLKVRFRPDGPVWLVQVESYNTSDPNQTRLNVKGITQAWRNDGIIDSDSQILENQTKPIDYKAMYTEIVEALKVIKKHIG